MEKRLKSLKTESKIRIIDHFDSFTYNLVDWLRPLKVEVIPYNQPGLEEDIATNPSPLLFSPGPSSVHEIPESIRMASRFLGKVPIFGVCLGHQILAHIAGLASVKSLSPLHGLPKSIFLVKSDGFFRMAPLHVQMASYHSLVPENRVPLKKGFEVSYICSKGEIHALEWGSFTLNPAASMQLHPESFLSLNSDFFSKAIIDRVVKWYQFK